MNKSNSEFLLLWRLDNSTEQEMQLWEAIKISEAFSDFAFIDTYYNEESSIIDDLFQKGWELISIGSGGYNRGAVFSRAKHKPF